MNQQRRESLRCYNPKLATIIFIMEMASKKVWLMNRGHLIKQLLVDLNDERTRFYDQLAQC